MCKTVCKDYLGVLGTYSLASTLDQAICIHCGQCANVCPMGAITEKRSYHLIREASGGAVMFGTQPVVSVAEESPEPSPSSFRHHSGQGRGQLFSLNLGIP